MRTIMTLTCWLIFCVVSAEATETINVTLVNYGSFPVTYEITDIVCDTVSTIDFQPWERVSISICSDGHYGEIVFRDVRNMDGVGVSLIRHGAEIKM